MLTMRTEERTRLYNSSWELASVLGRCCQKKIDPRKIVATLGRCHKLVKNFAPEHMAGALVIMFKLFESE